MIGKPTGGVLGRLTGCGVRGGEYGTVPEPKADICQLLKARLSVSQRAMCTIKVG